MTFGGENRQHIDDIGVDTLILLVYQDVNYVLVGRQQHSFINRLDNIRWY